MYTIEEFDKAKTKILKYIIYKKRSENEIRRKYEKEIDEMEEVLFPNGVLPDDGETEEEAKAAYKKLVDRLKADGVYEEDEPEKVKIVYLPEKKRHKFLVLFLYLLKHLCHDILLFLYLCNFSQVRNTV